MELGELKTRAAQPELTEGATDEAGGDHKEDEEADASACPEAFVASHDGVTSTTGVVGKRRVRAATRDRSSSGYVEPDG